LKFAIALFNFHIIIFNFFTRSFFHNNNMNVKILSNLF
jgi:hypothetical protein